MNYNCIYFHLKKLQLGPIDAAFQKLQYALKNSARTNFFEKVMALTRSMTEV